ncbi:MAG: ParB/RepB/Spo0J family partition protein [Clostridia bacterium]|jgi:ParB family chromosome partitioning protein|nr:ParB/RepB/Spo0J family partition protein [Clostridia bacterium]
MKNETNRTPVLIPVDKLRPFEGHPYKVIDNDEMNSLIESIQEQGIMSPLIVRPIENTDEYEVISGHRRLHAAEKAGIREIPALIYALDRDTAAIAVVDSNLHREHILPSEKAFAYKLKMDAMSHQGKRTDLTSDRVGPKLTADEISDSDSATQVKRYIRLTYLVPELLEYMDEGRMAFSVGVELSYLDTDFQYAVLDAMSQEDCTPSYAQAVRMKNMYREEMLTEDEIYSIVCEEKANQQEKVSFKAEDLRRFFPKSYTTQDMEKAIIQIVEADYRRRQRNRDDGAR